MSKSLSLLIDALMTVDKTLAKIIERDSCSQPEYSHLFECKYIFGKDLKYIYANIPGSYKLGLQPEDIVGRHWREINLPPENMEPVEKELAEVFRQGKSIRNEIVMDYETAYGLQFFEYSLSPIFDESECVEAVLCVLKDITEQKRHKEQHLKETEKLKQVIDAIPIPLVEVDKDGVILIVNDAFFLYDFKGLGKQDAIGRTFSEFMELNNRQHTMTRLYDALQGARSCQNFVDGGTHQWLMSAIPLYNGSLQEITGAIGVYENITEFVKIQEEGEQKQTELLHKYLNENLKLGQLIELCTAGIVLIDNQGRIERINQAYCDSFFPDRNVSEFLGQHGSVLAKMFGLEWTDTLFYLALKGITVRDQYLQTDKWSVLRSGIPIRNLEGEIVGALAIVYDITGHEKLALEMKKLDRLNIVGEMAAGVAHEVRNPMTVIKGYLQHYQHKCQAECGMRSRIPIILEELARVEDIVTDFLSLANNKATTKEFKNLNEIIRAVEPLVTSHALEHGMELKLELADKIPNMMLDEKEMRQLLINLARNAIEAMPKHGTLTFRTMLSNGELLLQVEDTGVGIPIEKREKIFNPFYTSKDNGTGLGLSICASIVQRHNGKITVQSELGSGTCFNISLPF